MVLNEPPQWWKDIQRIIWLFLEAYGFYVLAALALCIWLKPYVTRFLRTLQTRATTSEAVDPATIERQRAIRKKQQEELERKQQEWQARDRELRAQAAEERLKELDAKAARLGVAPGVPHGGRKLGTKEDSSSDQGEEDSGTPAACPLVPRSARPRPAPRPGFNPMGGGSNIHGFRPTPRRTGGG
mmetsp:Transcript_24926/g.34345  ORF Transcript_24926/g.34345 Transcript_24926/m.34345 type:complete len:185 (-) Transcript_24926:311-865(-)